MARLAAHQGRESYSHDGVRDCSSAPLCHGGYGGKRAKRRQRRMKRPAFEEMARLAAHQGRESYSHDGVRAAARPFVSFQGGAGGNRNPPAFLFRGLGGHSLFKREYPLGFSVPKRYSSAGNPGIFAPKIPSPYPKWEFPCGNRKIPVLTESPIPSPYRSD